MVPVLKSVSCHEHVALLMDTLHMISKHKQQGKTLRGGTEGERGGGAGGHSMNAFL